MLYFSQFITPVDTQGTGDVTSRHALSRLLNDIQKLSRFGVFAKPPAENERKCASRSRFPRRTNTVPARYA
jgi:hypothetical protein